MVFSSITFLYYFLPLVLFLYFLLPLPFKNICLLFFSLVFYFYGEPHYFWLILFSSIFHYVIAQKIEKSQSLLRKRFFLLFALFVNFGILFYFKYYNFFCENIETLFHISLPFVSVVLPLGISFFTFQTASYSIDVYLGKIKCEKNILTFITYLTMFPQLIAGPIVRYETVSKELKMRNINFVNISSGIKRFIVGLAKKVLLADLLGLFSATLSDLAPSVLGLWLQAIADVLQLYFDFSGYSDMAIGLGLILGFHFLENFNYPLFARSISDFWRRWHISLSTWFKDYLYIPLGGNRTSKKRWVGNLFLVWICTGLWHGASWNFILWGIYFCVFLLLEKCIFLPFLKKHLLFSHLYTIFIVIIGFSFFTKENLSTLWFSLKGMFLLSSLPLSNLETLFYWKDYFLILFFALLFATPLLKKGIEKWKNKKRRFLEYLEPVFYLGLFLLCTAFIVDASFQPFLYFRF